MNQQDVTNFFNSILKDNPKEAAINFKTAQDAFVWFENDIDDDFYDNHRIVFFDKLESKGQKYCEIYQKGCCGSDDTTVIINGRLAFIGCNFGH